MNTQKSRQGQSSRKTRYITIKVKFITSVVLALVWLSISIYFSIPWVKSLATHVTLPISILIIAGIAYIPGYTNAFMVSGLLLDRQPASRHICANIPVTILVACYNEEKSIANTLKYISMQKYEGKIYVIVIDNNSKDRTSETALQAGKELNLDIKVLFEPKPGKNFALNAAIDYVKTKYVMTLDADTLLHNMAIQNIVSRILIAPDDVCAVAGAVLVRNGRGNLITKIQEWDYFLGIASIKRLQGLFQGTLVAQGAFSLYETEAVKLIGGWPDAIGEDIVLTWKLLRNKRRVYFEPLAVAFTDVPESAKHFYRQRSRWARGMIEALKVVKPWNQPLYTVKYLTGYNLIMPYLDFVYTFCWLPGLVMAFFGCYWIVGLMTLFVLPLALLQNYILYRYQKSVFDELDLKIRKNIFGFILYVLFYQMIMSPVAVLGYLHEVFSMKRVWK